MNYEAILRDWVFWLCIFVMGVALVHLYIHRRLLYCCLGFHGKPRWTVKLNHNEVTRRVYGYRSFLICPYCGKQLSLAHFEVQKPIVAFHGKRPVIGADKCDCGAYIDSKCSGFCYDQTPQQGVW